MPNRNYLRSRARETQVRHQGETEGWFAVRAAGSKGIADVIWIKPSVRVKGDQYLGGTYQVKFIQIKVSEHLQEKSKEIKMENTPFGEVAVEYWKFPVRTRK